MKITEKIKSNKILQMSIVAILITAIIAASGCADTDPQEGIRLVREGYLTIGTDAAFPPFEIITATDEFYGFDIALGTAIAKELGLEAEFVNADWAGIIPALQAGKFDIVMSAMTIREDRQEQVNFSDPYFLSELCLTVLPGSPITSVDDLEGKVIGVQLGTTSDFYVEDLGFPERYIRRYPQAPTAFLDLKNRNIDAVINDYPVSRQIVDNEPGVFSIVQTGLTEEYYGIAVAKHNVELLEQINAALAKLQEDGTYDEIYEEYILNWDPPN